MLSIKMLRNDKKGRAISSPQFQMYAKGTTTGLQHAASNSSSSGSSPSSGSSSKVLVASAV